MKKVDGNETGIYDGIASVIWGDKGKTIVLSASGKKDDRFLSLENCLTEIGYDGKGTVTVLLESFLSGKVYCYNNYLDGSWWEYGNTEGLA